MQTLLKLAGYADYHATCLSPFLWALVAFALMSLVVGWWCDRAEKQARRKAIQRRRRHGRR